MTPEIIDFLSNYQRVRFGINFDQSVDKLPDSLICLEFDIYGDFNQPIYKLPNSLNHLVLGEDFNHPVDIFKIGRAHV